MGLAAFSEALIAPPAMEHFARDNVPSNDNSEIEGYRRKTIEHVRDHESICLRMKIGFAQAERQATAAFQTILSVGSIEPDDEVNKWELRYLLEGQKTSKRQFEAMLESVLCQWGSSRLYSQDVGCFGPIHAQTDT